MTANAASGGAASGSAASGSAASGSAASGSAASAGLALRCLALDSAALATSDLLRQAGVPSVLLKGAGLAHRLGVERLYGDVDLLVAPASFAAAQTALAAAGYRPREDTALHRRWGLWHEQTWSVPGPVPFVLDLHRGFARVGDADELWTVLYSGAEPVTLAGGTVLVPDEAGCALLVALHAASPGGSARPLADLARALDVLPLRVWPAAAALAERCAALSAFTVGLRLLPVGAAVAAGLGLPATGGRSYQLAAQRASPLAINLADLDELSRWRRLRRLATLALPTPDRLRLADPLAGHGAGTLFLAHLRRYRRHARALPRALRELRAARRHPEG
ncbi:nucleotidyltransferase family protein [Micromonospora yangpuensis]|uniref:nucleotidyltransferase family protein n=1 Tax=Micromonospora yangpuensis TaxID=683228 RepID=UPI001586BB9C|nr:nucleotidyltransferase family protein [Micromonospora yangpuensis]